MGVVGPEPVVAFRPGAVLFGSLDGCLLAYRRGRLPVGRCRLPVLLRGQPVEHGGMAVFGCRAPLLRPLSAHAPAWPDGRVVRPHR